MNDRFNVNFGENTGFRANFKADILENILKNVIAEYFRLHPDAGISDEKLADAINDYFTAHPVDGIDADEVNGIIADYLQAHPVETLTENDVNNIVAAYIDNIHITDGKDGKDGENGASAYEIAVKNGFTGTEAQWLASLKGEKGDTGNTGAQGERGERGEKGETGTAGINGTDGKSAYQIAVDNGFVGTQAEWLLSLKGAKGDTGAQGIQGVAGVDGKSAYQIAVDNGFSGTEEEWLESLKADVDLSDYAKSEDVPSANKLAFDDFCNNVDVDYEYDAATGANYTLVRIYRDKLDGTKQFPFVYAPNGANVCQKSTYEIANEDGYFLAINGGIFHTDTHIADGMLVENGIILKANSSQTHSQCRPLVINSNGELSEAAYDADVLNLVQNGAISVICGFMAIIKNYQAVPSTEWNDVTHYTENVQRQIIGQFGNGDYAILTCEGRNYNNSDGWTISEAQQICIKHGLKFAYNLDGGGSTETMLGLKHFNQIYEGTTGRKVPTFIVFNGKDSFENIYKASAPIINVRKGVYYTNNKPTSYANSARCSFVDSTPNKAPLINMNTQDVEGYMIPIPSDAISVTFYTPDYIVGAIFFNDNLIRVLDNGWGEVGSNTIYFNKGQYQYVVANVKNTDNSGINNAIDTSNWTIAFNYE